MNFIRVFFVVFLSITALYLLMIAYETHGFMKGILHDKLKWHLPEDNATFYYDGCSKHAKCRFCGKDIIQDSQGNWF